MFGKIRLQDWNASMRNLQLAATTTHSPRRFVGLAAWNTITPEPGRRPGEPFQTSDMKPCKNPHCQTESYDPERDGEWSDYCPGCNQTTCSLCGGRHDWDGGCPFCREKGCRDCIYDDADPHCDGCPFQGECEWYEDYQEMLDREIHESRLVDQYLGK